MNENRFDALVGLLRLIAIIANSIWLVTSGPNSTEYYIATGISIGLAFFALYGVSKFLLYPKTEADYDV